MRSPRNLPGKYGPFNSKSATLHAAGLVGRIERGDLRFQDVEQPHQPRHFHIDRLIQNARRHSALHQFAVAQDEHFIAQFQTLFQIVRHQHNGSAVVRAHLPQDRVEFGP